MNHYSGAIPDTEPAGQWIKQAACIGRAEEMFPDNNEAGIAHAKMICGPCPVWQECLEDALRTGDNEHGIRGGLKPGERRAIAKRRLAAPRTERTLQTLWDERAQPHDDGHVTWKGAVPVGYQGSYLTPHQIAFELDRGRPPVGTVRRTCDRDGCVLPAHIADQEERDQQRAADTRPAPKYSASGRALAACGTRSAYQRHIKNKEPIDAACRQANTDAHNRLARTGTTKAAA